MTPEEKEKRVLDREAERELLCAVRLYLSEYENPVPDYILRLSHRERMRKAADYFKDN
jgi:hypothetical protein